MSVIDSYTDYVLANIDLFFTPPPEYAWEEPHKSMRYWLGSCQAMRVRSVEDREGDWCGAIASIGDTDNQLVYCVECWREQNGE